jgi:hypothetical protein
MATSCAKALPPLSRGALRSVAAGGTLRTVAGLQQLLVLRLHALDVLPGDVYVARVSDADTAAAVLLDPRLTPLAKSGALRPGVTLVVAKCVACALRPTKEV